jgi:hypothetical protein
MRGPLALEIGERECARKRGGLGPPVHRYYYLESCDDTGDHMRRGKRG